MLRRFLAISCATSFAILTSCGTSSREVQIAPQKRVENLQQPRLVNPLVAADVAFEHAVLYLRANRMRFIVAAVQAQVQPAPAHEAPDPAPTAASEQSVTVAAATTSQCGGDLPPCYIMERESHGNPYAVEPGHAGAPYGDPGDPWTHASGKWQFMPGTWNGYDGYPYAAAAPESVQDAKAREVWAGGAGAGHWACC